MIASLRRLPANPLLSREAQRWRRRLVWVVPLAFVSGLLTCVLSGAPLLAALSNPSEGGHETAARALVVIMAISCAVSLAWLVIQIVLPLLAGTATNQLHHTGLDEALRLTLVTGRDVADGYFARALLRYPLWMLVIPLLPLGGSTLWISQWITTVPPGEVVTLSWITWAGLLLYPLLTAAGAAAQLAASVEIGVVAGMHARSAGAAAVLTLGGLFVLQFMLPSGCGLCLPFGDPIMLGFGGSPDPDGGMPIGLVVGLFTGVGRLLYQVALFFVARVLAARRFEQADV